MSRSILLIPLARGLALFLGAFSVLNLLLGVTHRHFDANLWWIDLSVVPPWLAEILLLLAGIMLLAYALRPHGRRWRAWMSQASVGTLLIVALINAGRFFLLLESRGIVSEFPVPFSLLVAIVLGVILLGMRISSSGQTTPTGRLAGMMLAGTALACLLLFPLAQMFCFGLTDYRRQADVIVVFGARVYADGTLSTAVGDRVRTACELYHQGFAGTVIFSGGPGDGPISEPSAMRQAALDMGVPDSAIILDDGGLNTAATVTDTLPLFTSHGWHRVLAVSHYYHLPRVKLTYQHAGVDVFTVPARQSYILSQTPHLIAREIVALWAYYLQLHPENRPRPAIPRSA